MSSTTAWAARKAFVKAKSEGGSKSEIKEKTEQYKSEILNGSSSSSNGSSSSNNSDEKTAMINVDGTWVKVSQEQYNEFSNEFLNSSGGTYDSDKALVRKYASIYSKSPKALVKDALTENKNNVVNSAVETAISKRNSYLGMDLNDAKNKAGNQYNFISNDGLVTAVVSKSGSVLAGTGIHELAASKTYNDKNSGFYYENYDNVMDNLRNDTKNNDNYDTYDVNTTARHEENGKTILYNVKTNEVLGIYDGKLTVENGMIKADKSKLSESGGFNFKTVKGYDIDLKVESTPSDDGESLSIKYNYNLEKENPIISSETAPDIYYILGGANFDENGNEIENQNNTPTLDLTGNVAIAPVVLTENEYKKWEQTQEQYEEKQGQIAEMIKDWNPDKSEAETVYYKTREHLDGWEAETANVVKKGIDIFGYVNPITVAESVIKNQKPSETTSGRIAKTIIETPIIAGEELFFGSGVALGVAAEEKSIQPLNAYVSDMAKGMVSPFVEIATGNITPETLTLAAMVGMGAKSVLKGKGNVKSVLESEQKAVEQSKQISNKVSKQVKNPITEISIKKVNTDLGDSFIVKAGEDVRVIPEIESKVTTQSKPKVNKGIETPEMKPVDYNPVDFMKMDEIGENPIYDFKEPLTDQNWFTKKNAPLEETTLNPLEDGLKSQELLDNTNMIIEMNKNLDKKTIFEIAQESNKIVKGQKQTPIKNTVPSRAPWQKQTGMNVLSNRNNYAYLGKKFSRTIPDNQFFKTPESVFTNSEKQGFKVLNDEVVESYGKNKAGMKKPNNKESVLDWNEDSTLTKGNTVDSLKHLTKKERNAVYGENKKSSNQNQKKKTLTKEIQEQLGFKTMNKAQLKYLKQHPEMVMDIAKMSKAERAKYNGNWDYLVGDLESRQNIGKTDLINNENYYSSTVKPEELNAAMKVDIMGIENVGNVLSTDKTSQLLIKTLVKNSKKTPKNKLGINKAIFGKEKYVNNPNRNSFFKGKNKEKTTLEKYYETKDSGTVTKGFRNKMYEKIIEKNKSKEKIKTKSKETENLKKKNELNEKIKDKSKGMEKIKNKGLILTGLGKEVADLTSEKLGELKLTGELQQQKTKDKQKQEQITVQTINFKNPNNPFKKQKTAKNDNIIQNKPKTKTENKYDEPIRETKDPFEKTPPLRFKLGKEKKKKRYSSKNKKKGKMDNWEKAVIQADLLMVSRAELLYGVGNVKDTITLNKSSDKRFDMRLANIGFSSGINPLVKKTNQKANKKLKRGIF